MIPRRSTLLFSEKVAAMMRNTGRRKPVGILHYECGGMTAACIAVREGGRLVLGVAARGSGGRVIHPISCMEKLNPQKFPVTPRRS